MNSGLFSTLLRGRSLVLTALALTAIATAAHADTVNIVNGGFEQTKTQTSSQFGAAYSSQQVTGWSNTGYNFVYLPGTADTTGAVGSGGNVALWGPGNGSNNGLTASPNGGNFLALDGAYEQGPVSQTLTGLKVGDVVTISFDFAGAQQSGFTGPTTEQLEVSLGGQNDFTQVLQDTSHGFTGWNTENLTFTATSSSEVLSFLAIGTPSGVPPMSLLDGVSASQQSPVPEPGSLALLSTGLIGLSGFVRSRFKKDNA
jgi:hypothetical protein